jgi:hypothetical protein
MGIIFFRDTYNLPVEFRTQRAPKFDCHQKEAAITAFQARARSKRMKVEAVPDSLLSTSPSDTTKQFLARIHCKYGLSVRMMVGGRVEKPSFRGHINVCGEAIRFLSPNLS